MGEKSKNTAVASRSLPKEFNERTGIASRLISSPSAGQSRKVTFSTGSGAFPPIAALDHEAAKNSAFVSIRSAVRDFIRSWSKKKTSVPSGKRSRIVSKLSVRSGISDSIPSTIIPSVILSRISIADGYCCFNDSARSRIASVSKSSRQGRIESFPTTGDVVL